MRGKTYNLTPFRREVLNRMFESGRPLSIAEAMDGHPNIMPTLCNFGWAKYQHNTPFGYVITDAGMKAIGFEIVESESAISTSNQTDRE